MLCIQQDVRVYEKWCEATKFLNHIRYEREKKEKKLAELQEELERMICLEQNSHGKHQARVCTHSIRLKFNN